MYNATIGYLYLLRNAYHTKSSYHPALHIRMGFLFRVSLRWLERDTSTNLYVIQKPSSPWPFQIISAHCWRQTWSVISTKRTRCLCPTLTRAWPICQKGAAATLTPITKATCINTSDSQGPPRASPLLRDAENLWILFNLCLIFVVCILFLNNNTQKGAFPVALFYGLPWTVHFIWEWVGVI